ncbi:hypothetical protein TNCV_2585171 [Trichonephila clavipes]|nr:hypothetical protein TNCV_2585171 [Trichonephila clavipes]
MVKSAIINDPAFRRAPTSRIHAQEETPSHIIAVGWSPKFDERTLQSYYRNDPMKYDLNSSGLWKLFKKNIKILKSGIYEI